MISLVETLRAEQDLKVLEAALHVQRGWLSGRIGRDNGGREGNWTRRLRSRQLARRGPVAVQILRIGCRLQTLRPFLAFVSGPSRALGRHSARQRVEKPYGASSTPSARRKRS